MTNLRCEVAEGLRQAEVSITVTEFDGRLQYFPLDRGLVSRIDNRNTIPVRVIQRDDEADAFLVSLPVEADSGTHRIWVRAGHLEQVKELAR